MSDLRKRLAEVLAKAWPGQWIVIDDDGEPCIEAVGMYDKPCRYFVVDSCGVGGDTSNEPETATPFENAEAIAAAVNYLRSPEFARALEDAERYLWLRNNPLASICVRKHPIGGYVYTDGAELDAAIDAARTKP